MEKSFVLFFYQYCIGDSARPCDNNVAGLSSAGHIGNQLRSPIKRLLESDYFLCHLLKTEGVAGLTFGRRSKTTDTSPGRNALCGPVGFSIAVPGSGFESAGTAAIGAGQANRNYVG